MTVVGWIELPLALQPRAGVGPEFAGSPAPITLRSAFFVSLSHRNSATRWPPASRSTHCRRRNKRTGRRPLGSRANAGVVKLPRVPLRRRPSSCRCSLRLLLLPDCVSTSTAAPQTSRVCHRLFSPLQRSQPARVAPLGLPRRPDITAGSASHRRCPRPKPRPRIAFSSPPSAQ